MAAALTRESIVAAARAAVEQVGVDQLSFRQVARDLGVTAPALYAYVEDKQALLEAVASDHFQALVDRFEAVPADLEPLERIRRLSRAYVEHALASPALFRVMFRFPPRPTAGQDAFPPAARAFEVAGTATEEAAAAGIITMDPAMANLSMWAALHGVAEVLLMGFSADEASADRLIDTVIESMLAGQTRPT